MSELVTDDTTYRIETSLSAGKIEDPVTGEQHSVESEGDSGIIEVSRADSAKYIVDSNGTFRFAGKAPSPEAVENAQREEFDFAGNEVCEAFAEQRGKTFGSQELDPTEGFDPQTDPIRNDPKMKSWKMYEQLQEQGFTEEAEYLRSLTSVDRQAEFVSFVREALGESL